MNNKEVIETLKKCFIPACEYHVRNRCNLSLDERFMKHSEVLDLAMEAIEKQIPKAAKCYEDKYIHCSCCDEFIVLKWCKYPTKLNKEAFSEIKYCWRCGNAIDFNEVE